LALSHQLRIGSQNFSSEMRHPADAEGKKPQRSLAAKRDEPS
jgi:hypothetical protein